MPQKCKAKVLIVFSRPLTPGTFSVLFSPFTHSHNLFKFELKLKLRMNRKIVKVEIVVCWINMVCLTWEMKEVGSEEGEKMRKKNFFYCCCSLWFDNNLFYLICDIQKCKKKVDRKKLFLCHALLYPSFVWYSLKSHKEFFSSRSALLMVR